MDCLTIFLNKPSLAHAALAIVLVSTILEQYFSYGTRVHKQRLEDCSVVEATIVEARTVAPRLTEPAVRPHDYDRKRKELQEEATRLEDIGSECWTEYQILPLSQMLVEFLAIDDLKEQARSSLSDIEEYAIDISYPLDIRRYDRWKSESTTRWVRLRKRVTNPRESILTLHRTTPRNLYGPLSGCFSSTSLATKSTGLREAHIFVVSSRVQR